MTADTTHTELPWPAYALPRGTSINGYRIERVLGSGGFGVTYLARDLLKQPCVIREYFPRQFAVRDGLTVNAAAPENARLFEDCQDRFRREAETLVSISQAPEAAHCLARVQSFFDAHGTCFVVMDYIEGENLATVLHRVPNGLPPERVSGLFSQLMAGVQIVHQAGLMHRDINPANIIMRDGNHPILIDFGSSRAVAAMQSAAFTQIYTGGYAPPEQTLGMPQGPYSDIYAIGAVCYQAIGGKVRDALVRRNTIAAGQPDPQQPAVEVAEGRYPGSLLAAIDAALAVDPVRRPRSIDELREVLGREYHKVMPTVVMQAAADVAKVRGGGLTGAGAKGLAIGSAIGALFIAAAASSTVWHGVTRPHSPDAKVAVAPVRPPPPPPAVVPPAAVVPSAAVVPPAANVFVPPRAVVPPTPVVQSPVVPPGPVVPLPENARLGWPPVTATAAPMPPIAAPPEPPSIRPPAPRVDIQAPASPPVPIVADPSAPPPSAPVPSAPTSAGPMDVPPPATTPPPVVSAPQYALVERTRIAARTVPCSALSVFTSPNGIRVFGPALKGPSLDRLLTELATSTPVTDEIMRIDRFACVPLGAVARLLRRSQDDATQQVQVRLDRREVTAGTRIGFRIKAELPILYVDFYQNDGLVRHIRRPGQAPRAAVPAFSGTGVIVALAAQSPLEIGQRPETDSVDGYLEALRPFLDNTASPLAVDFTVVNVRDPGPR